MSEGGFDYEAHRRSLQGNPDRALLVSFEYAPEKRRDGSFVNVEMIRIWMDKNTEVVRKVTEEDKIRFTERYEAFKKNEEVPEDGTPIKMVPFATPADVSACKSLRIFTLEQLVETSDDRLSRAQLINFKYQARDYLEAQRRTGYVGELRDEINHLKAQLEILKERSGEPSEEPVAKKRGGRPKKVTDGDTPQPS